MFQLPRPLYLHREVWAVGGDPKIKHGLAWLRR